MNVIKFGLNNLGNTCYFNAALQGLLSIPQFIEYLLDDTRWKEYYERNLYLHNNKSIIKELYDLYMRLLEVYDINQNTILVYNPITLFQSIKEHTKLYNGKLEYPYIEFNIGTQSDSFDMFNAIIGTGHDEIIQTDNSIDINNKIFIKLHKIYKNYDITKIDIPYNYEEILYFNYRFIMKNYSKEYSELQNLFTSFIINTTECLHCGDKTFGLMQTNVYEVDLQLPFIKYKDDTSQLTLRNKPYNLIDYMKHQLSYSLYTNEHSHKKNTGHLECCTYHKFWRIPHILVIRFKRFELINGVKHKINYPIEIPEVLDIKPFIHMYAINERCNLNTVYKLCASIQHSGSCDGGHYYTYGLRDRWYEFNDSNVRAINPDHSYSYYLIYYKVN